MSEISAPTELRLKRAERLLVVGYADGTQHELSFEYLRVFSPSAEVRGHGLGEPLLVRDKAEVGIRAVEPVGQYAVRLVFDDGHATGLYTWKVLWELIRDRERNWARYQERCAANPP